MTPREKYQHRVSDDVIVHELGHAIIGNEVGIMERGIELRDPSTGEIARAHYSTKGVDKRLLIIRGLAGMYVQARIAPVCLPFDLCGQILTGTLFSKHLTNIMAATVPPSVTNAGFQGDWGRIMEIAKGVSKDQSGILAQLNSAHASLQTLFINGKIEPKVKAGKRDFEQWFDMDDDNVQFMEHLIYPFSRLKVALNRSED